MKILISHVKYRNHLLFYPYNKMLEIIRYWIGYKINKGETAKPYNTVEYQTKVSYSKFN